MVSGVALPRSMMAMQMRKKIPTSHTRQFFKIPTLKALKTAMDDSTVSALSWTISGATGEDPIQKRILS
jgi:hypothetical protein